MTPRNPNGEDFASMEAEDHARILELLADIAAAVARGEPTTAHVRALAGWLAGYLGWSWLLGAARTLEEADAFPAADQPTPEEEAIVAGAPTPLGGVPPTVDHPPETPLRFREAIGDLMSRDPRLATNAQAVSEVMRTGGFAAAHSANVQTTRRVLDELRRMEQTGASSRDTATAVQAVTGWSRAYADTVVQTTSATAYSQGRMEQARRLGPRVAAAFEIVGPNDSIARANHVAAIGLVAGVNDPIWLEFAPPLGYRCRHSWSLVPRSVLARRGLLDAEGRVRRYEPPGFAEAHRDEGFLNVTWRPMG